MSIRFLHLSDIHLGVERYSRPDPFSPIPSRVQDCLQCVQFAFQTAIEEEVDFVLFTGDLYGRSVCVEEGDTDFSCKKALLKENRTLTDRSIPVVMVMGEMDWLLCTGEGLLLDLFGTGEEMEHLYVISRPELLRLDTKSGPVQVAGFPWPIGSLAPKGGYEDLRDEVRTSVRGDCTRALEQLEEELDPEVPSVLGAHIVAFGATRSGSESPYMRCVSPGMESVLANSGFDYVGLGHVHRFQELNPLGNPPVVCVGSLDRLGFEEEDEEKGFCVVTIAETKAGERAASYRFVKSPSRAFVTIEVMGKEEGNLTEEILEEIRRRDVRDAVVRVIYDTAAEERDQVDGERILDALSDAHTVAGVYFGVVERFYWTERAKKVLEMLTRKNAFPPSDEEVRVSEDLIRRILLEDRALSQEDPVFGRDEWLQDDAEVDRVARGIYEELEDDATYVGGDVRGDEDKVEEVIRRSDSLLDEIREEEWEELWVDDRCGLTWARLVRKGMVPEGEDREEELTMDLIREVVFAGMEWSEKRDKSSYALLTEFWYVNPDAKYRVYEALREKYGDRVRVDLEFIEELFGEIAPEHWSVV